MFRALPGSQPQRATTITFEPDLALFDMTELEEDTVALMEKRLYDVAGVLGDGCKVGAPGVTGVCLGGPAAVQRR